ncbi:MAG TPA: hypothetical protein DEG47_01645, partial [Cyanobacteria bacterium UBA11148]|nr:hypothetical protein [Cyanobacteria bacterium UBA11148]
MTGNQQTVLIVDDSAEDRAVYRRYLLQDATYTYQIFESESGEEALQLCHQIKLDVILLDFLLPDMDGLEFLNELKTQRSSPFPPIVMLTGQGNEAIAVQVMQNGVQNYLVKGQLTPESLHLAIHNVIDLSQQTTPFEQQTRTILIVDNCAKDRATYRSYLLQDSTYNYQIFESKSGEEALQSYLWVKPDAILLEFKLPGMDGLEFLNHLKTHLHRTQLPAIMITGQGDEAIAVQAIKNGAQDYLVKSNLTSAMLCRATKTIVQQTHLQGLLEQSQERQRLISAIALRIRQSLNLNEILNTTVTEVRQFLTCDRVVVYQFAPDMSGDIVAESVAPGWTPALGTTIQDTCFQTGAGENYRQGRKRAIDNIYEAELTNCHI